MGLTKRVRHRQEFAARIDFCVYFLMYEVLTFTRPSDVRIQTFCFEEGLIYMFLGSGVENLSINMICLAFKYTLDYLLFRKREGS